MVLNDNEVSKKTGNLMCKKHKKDTFMIHKCIQAKNESIENSTCSNGGYFSPMGPENKSTPYHTKVPQDDDTQLIIQKLNTRKIGTPARTSYAKKSGLSICLDTEFYYKGNNRIVLSYQFNACLEGVEYGFLFVPRDNSRTYISECLRYILDFVRLRYDIHSISYKSYIEYKKQYRLYELGELKEPPKIPKTYINIITHFGRADLTTFKVWGRAYNPIKSIREIQGGTISLENITGLRIRSNLSDNRMYPLSISYVDTMGHSVVGGKSLDSLGQIVNMPKVSISQYYKENMHKLFDDSLKDYIEYAMYDVRIPLLYLKELYGDINQSFPVTLSSGGAKLFQEKLKSLMGCKNNDEFNRKFRGLVKVEHMIDSDDELYINKDYAELSLEPLSSELKMAYNVAIDSYSGGLNTSYTTGYIDKKTYDYDLKSAYIVGLAMIPDIDYETPPIIAIDYIPTIEMMRKLLGNKLITPFFAYVDFEFPRGVKPTIPQRNKHGLIYTRCGKDVATTGIEIYAALMVGAKVKIRMSATMNTLNTNNVRECFKIFTQERVKMVDMYGKGSAMELIIKTISNSIYGKMAQGIRGKKAFLPLTCEMEPVGFSSITNPILATTATAIVRTILIIAANQIMDLGYKVYSITTDGMISDIPFELLQDLDLYGLRDIYLEHLEYIRGETEMWEIKHEQTEFLNIATRANFAPNEGGVLAKNSFKTDYEGLNIKPKSEAERIYLIEKILEMESGEPIYYKDVRFSTLRDIAMNNADFQAIETYVKNAMSFDYKNKPINYMDKTVFFNGSEYTCLYHESEPYDDIAEFEVYKSFARDYKPIGSDETGVIKDANACRTIEIRAKNKLESSKHGNISTDIGRAQAIGLLRLFLRDDNLKSICIGRDKIGRKGVIDLINEICEPLNPININDYKNNSRKKALDITYSNALIGEKELEFRQKIKVLV